MNHFNKIKKTIFLANFYVKKTNYLFFSTKIIQDKLRKYHNIVGSQPCTDQVSCPLL